MMNKSKKAEIMPLFKYALAGFMAIVIITFGYGAVNSLTGKACAAELAKFKIDVNDMGASLGFGEKEQQSYQIPCNADEVYFLDLEMADPGYLSDAFVKDSLETGSNHNVFLLKKGELKSSFSLGPMEVEYPYYKCLVPKFGKISFFLEGTQKSSLMTWTSNQPECTLIPVELSLEESGSIIDEAIEFGCEHCPSDAAAERANIGHTRENSDIQRKFDLEDDKKTKVEVRIKAKQGKKLQGFRYYESIPKECIDDLADYLDSVENEDAIISIKNDPLIVMYFDEVRGTKKVSYIIKKELSEECKELIRGLGVAQAIDSSEGD